MYICYLMTAKVFTYANTEYKSKRQSTIIEINKIKKDNTTNLVQNQLEKQIQ